MAGAAVRTGRGGNPQRGPQLAAALALRRGDSARDHRGCAGLTLARPGRRRLGAVGDARPVRLTRSRHLLPAALAGLLVGASAGCSSPGPAGSSSAGPSTTAAAVGTHPVAT